jgi:hypothetical protein
MDFIRCLYFFLNFPHENPICMSIRGLHISPVHLSIPHHRPMALTWRVCSSLAPWTPMLHQACDVKLCHPNSEKQYKPPKLESRLSHQLQRSFLFHVNMIDMFSYVLTFRPSKNSPIFPLAQRIFPLPGLWILPVWRVAKFRIPRVMAGPTSRPTRGRLWKRRIYGQLHMKTMDFLVGFMKTMGLGLFRGRWMKTMAFFWGAQFQLSEKSIYILASHLS